MPRPCHRVPFSWRELAAAMLFFGLVAGELVVTALLCGGGK